MNRRLIHCLAVLLLAFSTQAAQKLNLFIWSEYLPDDVAREFEKRFDCELVIDLFEDAESMLAKLQASGGAGYDVAVPADYIVPALIRGKLVAPLRKENVPNLKHLEPRFLNLPFDPGNKYSAVYGWGILGIYARKSGGKALEPTWGLFFDPELQPGPIVLMDSMRDLLGAALKYSGYSFNSVKPDELKKARDLVLNAKERSVGFATPVGGRTKVLEKSARAAIAYSADAARGMLEDPDTVFLAPREGSEIFTDNLVVLAQARNRDLAEKFINFILDPEIAARIANGVPCSTPNGEAKKFINPKFLSNPALYPEEAAMKKFEFLEDLGRNTRLYDQLWTSIKSR